MPLTIVQKGDPKTLEDVPRSYKPLEIREMTVSALEAIRLGVQLPSWTGRWRVMVLYGVSTVDSNKLIHLAKLLGPSRGNTPGVSILLGGEDDWGHAQDIMEARFETVQRREMERASRQIEWQKSMERQLIDVADNLQRKQKGESSFGQLGHFQRTS